MQISGPIIHWLSPGSQSWANLRRTCELGPYLPDTVASLLSKHRSNYRQWQAPILNVIHAEGTHRRHRARQEDLVTRVKYKCRTGLGPKRENSTSLWTSKGSAVKGHLRKQKFYLSGYLLGLPSGSPRETICRWPKGAHGMLLPMVYFFKTHFYDILGCLPTVLSPWPLCKALASSPLCPSALPTYGLHTLWISHWRLKCMKKQVRKRTRSCCLFLVEIPALLSTWQFIALFHQFVLFCFSCRCLILSRQTLTHQAQDKGWWLPEGLCWQ